MAVDGKYHNSSIHFIGIWPPIHRKLRDLAGKHSSHILCYVRNIKKYLLAALYNAPATIDSYYTSLVSHDMYGGGDRR